MWCKKSNKSNKGGEVLITSKELKELTKRVNKMELEKQKPKFKRGDLVVFNGFYRQTKGEYISRQMDLELNTWMCNVLIDNGEIIKYEEYQIDKINKKNK